MRQLNRLFWKTLGLGLLALSLTQPAFAKTRAKKSVPQGPTAEEYKLRLDELEQKQKILERNLELKDEAEKEKEKSKPIIKASTGGISISSADGNNEIRFRGLIQADARFYLDRNGQGAVNTFELRRLRPYIEGRFAKHWEFRIMPDFGDGKVVLQDGYINTVIYPYFKIELGKYKSPVGLERLEAAADLHFVERGLPTDIAPNRDLGVMFHGNVLDGVFQYQLGLFNGEPDGASADFDFNNAKDFEGRVFAQPFKKTSIDALKGLGFGVSGTIGHQSGTVTDPQLPQYKSIGQQTFFKYLNDGTPTGTALPSGTRWRVSPQGYYYYKGFGLLGEFIKSSQEVTLNGSSTSVGAKAWQVAATYVIGADNSFGQIKPRKPLGWTKGGTGAFEFGARYNELSIDKKAFPTFADPTKSASRARAWGVGFNWYINDNAKFMIDFDQTHFEGGAKGGNRQTENVVLNRYQLNF